MSKYNCMLAQNYSPALITFPCFIQPKLDGVRGIYDINLKKFKTRNDNVLNLPRLEQSCSKIETLFDLDGELHIKGQEFNESSGIIRTKESIDKKNLVHYTVFDIIAYVNYDYRYKQLLDLISPQFDNISLIKSVRCFSYDEIDAEHKKNILVDKYEGSIIRVETAGYEFKRSFSLLKRKEMKTAVCKIINYTIGTGKYEDTLGSVLVEFGDKCVWVGSGFTDYERYCFWSNKNWLSKQTVRIKYQDLSEYGIPRFPVFVEVC